MVLRESLVFKPSSRGDVAEIEKVARDILNEIDQGAAPSASEAVAERIRAFNAMTGREYTFDFFRTLHCAMSVGEFAEEAATLVPVRVPDITRAELIEIVRLAMTSEHPANVYYMALFDRNVPMPGASNLIFWPENWETGQDVSGYDPTPEEIVDAATAPNRVIML